MYVELRIFFVTVMIEYFLIKHKTVSLEFNFKRTRISLKLYICLSVGYDRLIVRYPYQDMLQICGNVLKLSTRQRVNINARVTLFISFHNKHSFFSKNTAWETDPIRYLKTDDKDTHVGLIVFTREQNLAASLTSPTPMLTPFGLLYKSNWQMHH